MFIGGLIVVTGVSVLQKFSLYVLKLGAKILLLNWVVFVVGNFGNFLETFYFTRIRLSQSSTWFRFLVELFQQL